MLSIDAINDKFAASRVGRYFDVEGRRTTLTTEIRAGFVTFLTTCYILAVNSSILSDTGGTCTDADCSPPGGEGCRFDNNPGFDACVAEVRKSLVSATAATSLMACFLMGAVANMPLAIAPGMGINAYFTYTVVGFYGTGIISYQEALAAVFIEGWIFILISLTGVRSQFVSLVPKCIMLATAGGIGLFLAFIGLQYSEGLGVVTADPATLVTLGGCPPSGRVYAYYIANTTDAAVCSVDPTTGLPVATLGAPSTNYQCVYDKMRLATMWLGIAGAVVMVICMAKKVKGAIMIGIIFTTAISWIPGQKASYLGDASQIPGGQERLDYFKNVVSVPNASKTTLVWSFSAFGDKNLWIALITFLYLDFLDATGTLFSMASMLDHRIPGFVDPITKKFPRQIFAFCVDGTAIVIGSILGCAPLTVFIESASGIREGGRTGIVALTVCFGYFVSLWFTPLIVSIPPYATGPALILVGAMMMENVVDIDWADVRQAVPAFVTIVTMPLTYSIAYGVIAGVISYMALYVCLLVIDLTMALVFKQGDVRQILREAVPDVWAGRIKQVDPLRSPSAILQERTDPERKAHAEAVAAKHEREAENGYDSKEVITDVFKPDQV